MRYLVLGSGRMGRAIVYDLLHFQNADQVLIGDLNPKNLKEIEELFKSPKVKTEVVNVTHTEELIQLMKGIDCVISSVVYEFNHYIAQAAVEAGVHYCDLGQNIEIVDKTMELNEKAKEKKITMIPDGGLAPGMVNIIAADSIKRFDEVEEVQLRVGGLPQKPVPPLNYSITWSVHGLINEYIEKARIIRDYKLLEIPSMSELEEIDFPAPFNKMEAFVTSGGTSTLPLSYQGKIKELNYKTIRYQNHYEIMKAFIDLGFTDESFREVDGQKVVPRHLFETLLKAKLVDQKVEDVVLLKVIVTGRKGKKRSQEIHQLIDYYSDEQNLTALMRTTGFSLAIVAGLITSGKINQFGVLTQEESIPGDLYFQELRKRDIHISYTNLYL